MCGGAVSPSHPTEGGSGGMVQVLRPCSTLDASLGPFRKAKGSPLSLSSQPPAARGQAAGLPRLPGAAGRGEEGEACLSQWAALALDLGPEREREKGSKMWWERQKAGVQSQAEVPGAGSRVGGAVRLGGWAWRGRGITPRLKLGSRGLGLCLQVLDVLQSGSWVHSSPGPEVPWVLGSFLHLTPLPAPANRAAFQGSGFGTFPVISLPLFLPPSLIRSTSIY